MVFAHIDWGYEKRGCWAFYVDNAHRCGLDPAINLNIDHPNRPNNIVDRVNEAAKNNPAARNFMNDIQQYLCANRRNVDCIINHKNEIFKCTLVIMFCYIITNYSMHFPINLLKYLCHVL